MPSGMIDPVNERMRSMPTTVISTTLEGPFDWPDATVVRGDAVEVVARLKDESDVPLRSHGSLSMNRALMAAGLVDRLQLTLFPVISGQTGAAPIFENAGDFDLELIESRTLDGNIQELIYRPTVHPRQPSWRTAAVHRAWEHAWTSQRLPLPRRTSLNSRSGNLHLSDVDGS
jgi:dihydrofolate reductase